MIRILHILHSMNRGGAEAMLMNYYRNIDRTRVQFDFLLTEQNRCQYEDEIEQMGGKVFRIPLLRFSNPLPYVNGVRKFFAAHPEYRVVHSHTSSKSAVPLWVAKLCGVPVRVCHSHNNRSESGLGGFVRDALKIPLRQVATDFFACGQEAALWLYGKEWVRRGRVEIVPNAIQMDVFGHRCDVRDAKRKDLGVSPQVVLMGMVARFSHQKNHLFAIDVLHRLMSKGYHAKLLLVGDGELRPAIEQRILHQGLTDDVILAGLVNDVPNYLQAMDMVLMPSFNEGLPVSLIEAQANGLSIVASTGVPAEVNVTGNVTFLPLDTKVWADFLAGKMQQGVMRDADAMEKVRMAGYDIKTAAKKLEEWYMAKI